MGRKWVSKGAVGGERRLAEAISLDGWYGQELLGPVARQGSCLSPAG